MKIILKHISGQVVVFEIANRKIISVSAITNGMPTVSTLDNLKFSREGILLENPDLVDMTFTAMKMEAIRRVKAKLAGLATDEDVARFIVDDFKPHNYSPVSLERKGWRSQQIKGVGGKG